MKCPSCGTENAEHLAYCGKCGQELPGRINQQNEGNASRIFHETSDEVGPTQLEALISTAINARRIALVLILLVFLSIVSTLFGLWVSIFEPGIDTAKEVATVWLVLALLVMIGGLYMIINRKRLTRL